MPLPLGDVLCLASDDGRDRHRLRRAIVHGGGGDRVLGVEVRQLTRTTQTGSKGGGRAMAQTREIEKERGSSAVNFMDNFERIRGFGVPYSYHIWAGFEGC